MFDTPGLLDPAAARTVLADDEVFVTTRVVSAAEARAVGVGVVRRSGPRFAFVATSGRSADLAHLLELVRAGRMRVPVDRIFPMVDAVAAHRRAGAATSAAKW